MERYKPMLYINKEKNSLIFDQENFEINYNYLPMLFQAFGELDPNRTIHFAIELEKTPVLFILFLHLQHLFHFQDLFQ